MKTRDRVATALAPHEAEAIIEQARRRQRRRRRMIGLELVAVVVVWLVVMSVASGGIWDPFAAQGGARSAGARARRPAAALGPGPGHLAGDPGRRAPGLRRRWHHVLGKELE